MTKSATPRARKSSKERFRRKDYDLANADRSAALEIALEKLKEEEQDDQE